MAVKWYLLPRDTDWNRYWDSHSIDAERVYTRTEYPRLLEIFTTYLRPDDVFFEGGCGLGRWLHYLKEQGHQKLIGLDFTVQPIMKSKAYDPQLDFLAGPVDDIPLRTESVDFYFSGGVMEHFEEGPGRCLMEAHRILKKDGILVLSVPYQNVYRGTVRRFFTMPLLKLLKPKFRNKYRVFYQYYYSRRDLMKFLRKANFLPLEWLYVDRFHTSNQRAGIALEFPFLRKRNGVQWEVKPAGIFLARLAEAISKSIFASSIIIVARKQ